MPQMNGVYIAEVNFSCLISKPTCTLEETENSQKKTVNSWVSEQKFLSSNPSEPGMQ